MRILLLVHAFNSLSQRLYVELAERGHELSVEFDIHDRVTEEAVGLFRPHLILAPYLRRAIPESVWRRQVCLVVHPGIVGDRGPSALDWAILDGSREWGVTLLQAEAELDAGPVWAAQTFPMRPARKSALYRHEVTEAAVRVVLAAIERLPDYLAGRWRPTPVQGGRFRPLLPAAARSPDWQREDSAAILRKLACSDGAPGAPDVLFGQPCRLFDARAVAAEGPPGALLGRIGEGIVRATVDGAVFIGQVRRLEGEHPFKLPVALAFPEVAGLPELAPDAGEIRYEEAQGVGYLHFELYNGAMGSEACERLRAAWQRARARPIRVIVLLGGADFFSNGLDLNRIEAAASPADESWRNIQAMDDLCQAILETDDQLTVAALQGNAGAGGAFLALAADRVWARRGVVLNPHYKGMGNLYGSEYWTYLLPKRVGARQAEAIIDRRLPMGTAEAVRLGFIDEAFGDDPADFLDGVRRRATELAQAPDFAERIAEKRRLRAADEAIKPLSAYRDEELAHMRRNFYGFDPSYHVARRHFVYKTPHAWTPRQLARHRELGWRLPEPAL